MGSLGWRRNTGGSNRSFPLDPERQPVRFFPFSVANDGSGFAKLARPSVMTAQIPKGKASMISSRHNREVCSRTPPALMLLLLFFFLASCCGLRQPVFKAPVSADPLPWTEPQFVNNPENFQFAVVSDRTGKHREGVFLDAVRKINLLQPEFVICVGDLVEGYSNDKKEVARQFDAMDERLERFEMRFFRVAGNHDISNELMADLYRERYGRPYYHFVYGGVLFLAVCTEDPNRASISEEQIAYFRHVLEKNRDVRWTLVFMHQPLFLARKGDPPHPDWSRFSRLLEDRPHTLFAGHWHRYGRYEKNGYTYLHLATTGGVSHLRGIAHGEFDHFLWVTMTSEGPRIANVLLEGILDDNLQ
jgi:predicted phosphodiesterase